MIVPIMNPKGGTSKTTSTIALATAAARDGVNVIVLDADPQADTSIWAELAEEEGALPFEIQAANLITIGKVSEKYANNPHTWVFIDCPRSGLVFFGAAEDADIVIVPTTTSPIEYFHSK